MAAMLDYDIENIPELAVKKVNAILNLPEMNFDAVKSASRALAGIYKWSVLVMKYHELLCENPKLKGNCKSSTKPRPISAQQMKARFPATAPAK